jgi:hypothetical protein
MAFPTNPSHNQLHTVNDRVWLFNGYAWKQLSKSAADLNNATGILYGGILTANIGGSTFNVSAGIGQKINIFPSIHGITTSIEYITWDNFSGITIDNIGTNQFTYIYIDENGDLNQQHTSFTDSQYKNEIPIGVLCHIDYAGVNLVTNAQNVAYDTPHRVEELTQVFGPIKSSGLIVTPDGPNLSLNRDSGSVFKIGTNYVNDQLEPDVIALASATPSKFCRVYRGITAGSYNFDTNSGSFYNYIDPTLYDDGSGTLQTVNNNQWTVQRLYLFPNNPGDIICYYGIAKYNSYADARDELESEIFTEATITRENAVFLGYLIVRGGAANLNLTADGRLIQSGFCRGIGVGGGGGGGSSGISTYVSTINGLSGDIGITAGDGINISTGSSNITITNTLFTLIDGGLY